MWKQGCYKGNQICTPVCLHTLPYTHVSASIVSAGLHARTPEQPYASVLTPLFLWTPAHVFAYTPVHLRTCASEHLLVHLHIYTFACL